MNSRRKQRITTAMEVAGGLSITTGFLAVSWALGLIVLGGLLIAGSGLLMRQR